MDGSLSVDKCRPPAASADVARPAGLWDGPRPLEILALSHIGLVAQIAFARLDGTSPEFSEAKVGRTQGLSPFGLELLDAKFAEDCRALNGPYRYYPGELPT